MGNDNDKDKESEQTQQQSAEPDRDALPPDIEIVLNSVELDKEGTANLITEHKKDEA